MHVVDSMGVAVPDADVAVANLSSTILVSGVTDSTGHSSIAFSAPPANYEVIVRRIGYDRVEQRVMVTLDHTMISLEMVLASAVPTLSGVTVIAKQSTKWKSYHIDANEIAHSRRPLFDALDVLRKLRPDMLTSRAPEICADSAAHLRLRSRHSPAGGLSNIWVNGRRIRMVEVPPKWVRVEATNVFIRQEVLEVLREIRPQDIARMAYTDCMDTSAPMVGGQNALFITLKPGVAYERGRGTFVVKRMRASLDTAPGTTSRAAMQPSRVHL
ncbi:MAG TPA: carboxypeptidase-like regulatory domain-containing protein [Gemmatimonadaceae bacterium]|nr:carboxypeptidase-like regulatory domain-containing protein [Gemmatimonadaceae bacterium]